MRARGDVNKSSGLLHGHFGLTNDDNLFPSGLPRLSKRFSRGLWVTELNALWSTVA